MVYFFGALAVFYVLSIAEGYLELPRWGWQLVTLVLSVGIWLVIDEGDWWMPLAVAGMVVLAKAAEALLLVASDRARVDLLRGTRR
jgi:hypothetical protein